MASTQQHITVGNQERFLILEVIDQQLTEEAQVSAWQHQMAEAIRRASPAGVVIDMQHVEYMTSIAIFPLIATRAVADEIGARLILCNLSETVAKVLTVTLGDCRDSRGCTAHS
jgi:anti-anti-sigma factor